MLKNPNYRLVVYSNQETVTIDYPIACKFSITRAVLSDNNKASIQLYNLSPATREKIFQDAYTVDYAKFKYVYLYAGYGEKMPLIFKGRILQAYSHKSSGSTEVITDIQAICLDIFDHTSSYTFKAGTSRQEALNTMVMDLPNVTLKNVGTLEGEFLTDTTFEGNTLECLSQLTNGNIFVDNDTINCVETYEVIDVPVPVISDNSCLLETPMRRDANLVVKTVFMPDVIVGQLCEIKSKISPNFNGQFKVIGIQHDCMMSETQGGNRTTTLNLWIGVFLPNASITDSNNKTTTRFQKVKGRKIIPVIGNTPTSAREVHDYILKHKGKLPNSKCYGNITWYNMLGNDNTDAERLSTCTLEICTNAYYTAKAVYDMVTSNFNGKKPLVSSGWRSVRNNNSCGGRPKSRHLFGLACDFTVSGVPVNKAYPAIRNSWNGFTLNEGTWIHVQIEPKNGVANDK